MTTFLMSVVLLTVVENVMSDYNKEFCSIFQESNGLIPPPLPENFELKAEVVNHEQNFIAYEEVFFDYTNTRVKYQYLLDTIEYHYLFDFENQQLVEWAKVLPGVDMKRDSLSHKSCEAVDMYGSKHFSLFGYQDGFNPRLKMFNSNQALRYGGQYLYAANGTDKLDERGEMPVNTFVSCLYDSFTDTTVSSQFFFADTTSVAPSGGTPGSVAGLPDDKPMPVPVKIHFTGSVGNMTSFINETLSISWFKGNPVFKPETFQIPPWVHCENYYGKKEIPKLPKAFSTRVTRTKFSLDTLGMLEPEASVETYEEIYYDLDRRLARRDFTPDPITDYAIRNKFGSSTPVRTIYDFNQGLKYTINKASGSCYIIPIEENEIFDTEKDLVYREMATPEEVFLLQMEDMEYKGKAFARDVECDVYNGKHFHKIYNASFVKEVYFSTDGWHETTEGGVERRVPIKNVLINQKLDGEASESVSTYNFLMFNSRPPKMVHFDIKGCIEQIDHKRFAIELTLNDETSKLVYDYKFNFLEAAQIYIAEKTEVNTPLRVQRVYLRHQSLSNPRTFLVFTLLDKVVMRDYPTYPQKGKTIQQAIGLLQKLVDEGKFKVEFKNPNTKEGEVISIEAAPGSLYSLTASGNLTPAPLEPAKLRKADDDDEEATTKVKEGMTGGHLALLSFAMLFIGIGIGIAVMYLYLRVYSEHFVEDKIGMSARATSSSADGSNTVIETP